MAPEAVMAVGGLVVRPPGLNQHAGFAQDVQQRIAPQARVGLLQRFPEQMVQLSGSQPRLAQAHITHEFDHRLGTGTALLLMA